MALGCSTEGPINICKNKKQLRPYSQRHIFGFIRSSSLLQSTIVISSLPGYKRKASIAVRNYVNLNPETCLLLFQQRP